jgi:hypothetical protein
MNYCHSLRKVVWLPVKTQKISRLSFENDRVFSFAKAFDIQGYDHHQTGELDDPDHCALLLDNTNPSLRK